MPKEIKKQREDPETSGEALIYKEFMDALSEQLKSPTSRKPKKPGPYAGKMAATEPEKTQSSK